ncbi:uncharacterized protein LOC143673720 isoform X2 [Tamandua tetradactyla]|uniref:uncharacterized protein LOC143673720 isoform X2 n=1 Tax=Tamandua tetradactyla TaxID=48850 RepID=UPI0040547FDE
MRNPPPQRQPAQSRPSGRGTTELCVSSDSDPGRTSAAVVCSDAASSQRYRQPPPLPPPRPSPYVPPPSYANAARGTLGNAAGGGAESFWAVAVATSRRE